MYRKIKLYNAALKAVKVFNVASDVADSAATGLHNFSGKLYNTYYGLRAKYNNKRRKACQDTLDKAKEQAVKLSDAAEESYTRAQERVLAAAKDIQTARVAGQQLIATVSKEIERLSK